MLIKVEPAGFFMYTVQMIFDPDNPDPEDATVRDYLADNDLEPRYQYELEQEGRPCQVWQFGGCYLGRHLQRVGQIQRQAVEVELLTAAVESHLADWKLAGVNHFAAPPGVEGDELGEMVAALVAELNQESAFQSDEKGELVVVLNQEEVRSAAQRWLREKSATA